MSIIQIRPPVISREDVFRERDRRLSLGFDYDFGDARGVHRIGTTDEDRKGWQEVTDVSNAAINSGTPNVEITISTDTGSATITAQEWQSILMAAAAFRQPIWQASFVLTAMNPIPTAYTLDENWEA
jgi:hypothetical protein